MTRFLTLLFLAACGTPADEGDFEDSGDTSGDTGPGCAYPEAVEPMALNQPLFGYSWPEAHHANGATGPLDLTRAFCNTAPDIDWSPFDFLLFISVPAW